MKIIWVLIAFECEGHTNAVCWPNSTYFTSRQDCIEALASLPKFRWRDEPRGVCAIADIVPEKE